MNGVARFALAVSLAGYVGDFDSMGVADTGVMGTGLGVDPMRGDFEMDHFFIAFENRINDRYLDGEKIPIEDFVNEWIKMVSMGEEMKKVSRLHA